MTDKLLSLFPSGFLLTVLVAGVACAAQFNVKEYGAAGDGIRLDTDSINKTIRACAEAGGGTVYVPAGTYLTGTVHLDNNVTLWLDAGATIRGSRNLADYQSTVVGNDWFSSLIQGKGIRNVAVMGHGVIDGNKVFNPKGEERMRGPHALLLQGCSDILIRDISIRDASNYAVILRSCERANINGITVKGGWDGINMGDAKDVTISNNRFFTGDDCLAGYYWQNVTVANCILNTSCNGIRVGGRDIMVNNCLIYGPGEYEHRTSHRHDLESGFQLWSHQTGSARKTPYPLTVDIPDGQPDNINLSNVTMVNVRSPLWLAYGRGPGLGHVTINNLIAKGVGRTPFFVAGTADNPMRSLVLNNVRIAFAGEGAEEQADRVGPSPYSMLESYAFLCRYIENFELHGVRVGYAKKDLRPALVAESVTNLQLDGLIADREPDGAPPYRLSNVQRVLLDGKPAPRANARIAALDAGSATVTVDSPFSVAVKAENAGAEGLAEVQLQIGEKSVTKSVWLKEREAAAVVFHNLRCDRVGECRLRAGEREQVLTVRAKPRGSPVNAPYTTFHNTDAQLVQYDGDDFYIRAGGDMSVLDHADQYGAIYLKNSLPRSGVVTVRLENPDLRGHWAGRAGIMVRNDISKPGQSKGYLVLGASPANGYCMEWDSDGDGQIDRHTEFDGYTYWPHWLKLERRGSKFTGFSSIDGKTWTLVGEAEVPGAAETQDTGVFAHLSSARFTDLKVSKVAAP